MSSPDNLSGARGLAGWASIKDELESNLRSEGVASEDASRGASALAEIWHIAFQLQESVERIARDRGASDGLTSLLIQLQEADWNNLSFAHEALRLWRLITGTSWKPRREQIDSVEEMMARWWQGELPVRDAAALLVDLRLRTRKLAVALSDRDLLNLSERARPSAARKKVKTLISEMTQASRALRDLLEVNAD